MAPARARPRGADGRRSKLKRLLAIALLGMSFAARAELPEIVLTIGHHKLTAEVASTEGQRAKGLMFRRMLPENRGMLFVFPELARHSMWMANTYIPLSVAFIDAGGVIINIADMEPHTREPHSAARPARYALEMNRSWFAKRGIKAGDSISGLEQAGRAR
jgi:uncharacterized protein